MKYILMFVMVVFVVGIILVFTKKSAHAPVIMYSQPVQYKDVVYIERPLPNTQVKSPLLVSGRARGNWYFEGSFPVKLLDGNGNVLALAPAQAQSEWMTTEYVPFSVSLTFPTSTTATGTLILQKDNPSGDPQFDDSVLIPVTF